jgi:hypothetical protein
MARMGNGDSHSGTLFRRRRCFRHPNPWASPGVGSIHSRDYLVRRQVKTWELITMKYLVPRKVVVVHVQYVGQDASMQVQGRDSL